MKAELTKGLTRSLLAGAALCAIAVSAPALAQTEAAAAKAKAKADPEEVIVTARRREEVLKDVPIAVTAFSAEKLTLSGIQDITGLQKTTPNLTLQVARGSNSTVTAFIRGIGQQDPLWGFEPGVGLYVDDVYIARPQGAVLDIYNVDHIEVLRGPQGSLYGRNTIGGAVKYVTAPLSADPHVSVKVQAGSYNEQNLILTGSVPVTSAFRIGAGFERATHEGFGRNLADGRENYNKDLKAGRISAEYEPSAKLLVRFSADRFEDGSVARQGHREIPGDLGDAPVTSNVYDTWSGMSNQNKVINYGYNLMGRYAIDDNWTFKSISAYRKGRTDTNIDFASVPKPELQVPAYYFDHQYSQEFQGLYEGARLKGVFGVYYLSAVAGGNADTILSNAGLTLNFSGKTTTHSAAAFGDFSYDITDRLQIAAGGRYTDDSRGASVYRVFELGLGSPFFGGKAVPFQVRTNYANKKGATQFSPRVSLSYKLTDELTAYATYSEGFKSGGFDMRGDAFLTPATVNGYGPEKVASYEAGLKGGLFANRLTFSAAGFYADYTDLQVTIQTPVAPPSVGIASFVANAAKSRIQGFEAEARAVLAPGLTASVSAGLADAKFDHTPVLAAAAIFVFQNTPKWTGSAQVAYTFPETILGGDLTINGGAAYRSRTYQYNYPVPAIDQNGYTLFDANLIWTSASGHWRGVLSGLNLTDERYRTAGYNLPGKTYGNTLTAFYGDPQTIHVSVEYKY